MILKTQNERLIFIFSFQGGGGGGGGGGGVFKNGSWRREGRRRCGLVTIGWLSFEFFPYVVTVFFPFPSDLEIDSICLVFIEFFLSIGSSKMALVHGWFILGQGILCNFLVKIWIWFKIFIHGCDFRLTTAIILRVVWVFDIFC